jgi:putative phage-type endonuclease
MIVLECEQNSPEWHQARIGLPSASVFDKILTTKGELSKSSQKLIYQLAGELIVGEKEEGYTNGAMQRGIELESEARALFELITGKEVQEVGMCYYDERRDRSCSPDGLIADDEGLEIKCPSLAVHVEYLLGKKLPTTYYQQVQGSLYITGRKRWHFLSYYPGVQLFHIVVERDEEWIAKLDKALDSFVAELDETYRLLAENA